MNKDMNIKTMLASAAVCLPLFASAAPAGERHGIDPQNLDLNVKPADDFYDFACGGWMAGHPLTAEYSRFGTFDALRENNRLQLKELILNLASNPDAKVKGSNAQKVSDLYALGMDSVRLNREGAAPLRPQLDRIAAMTDDNFMETVAWMHNGIASVFFATGVGADSKNSDMNIMHIAEGGLGLGDRDYYLEDNDTNKAIMAAYEKYVKRLMELVGYDEAAQQRVWDNVIAVEKEMAKVKMTREQRRNPQLRYNIKSYADLQKEYPGIDWDVYFKTLGIARPDSANVSSTGYMEAISKILQELPLQARKDFMTFRAIDDATGPLSDDFAEASFELYDRVMSGKEEMEPRWKRAMAIPGSMLGEAVGELYVNKYFPAENKAYMVELVENLRTALGQHIDNLAWMSPETKAKAREKLAAFTVKIGYPDKWKDYSAIEIDPSKSYLDNVLQASIWYVQDNYAKLGKPVDKTEWHMTPQTVNAYYNPTTNEICFPAGILQAPYFDITADDALNYGGIGVVIGHEMTHGFDDQGRQFDKEGNLHDWWTAEDAASFNKLADALAAQFDQIEVSPGVHANGRFTLGENIADQGGLRVALTAYRNQQKAKGAKPAEIGGFSPLQRFYLSYAGLWAGNVRPEEILKRTKTDPHSLGRWRVNATLRNIEPFFEAFSIREGDKMFRPDNERVVIW